VVIALGVSSLLVYELLDLVAPRLALAEPSFAWQVFPWSHRPGPRLDATSGLDAIHWTAAWFTLALAGLTLLYIGLLASVRTGSVGGTTLAIFAFGVIFQLQQLDSPALLSSDPFSYLMYGRITSLHGGNPYIDLPEKFPNDPVLPLVYWQHVPSFYGPAWTAISAALARAAGDNIGLAILMFRSTAAAAAIGCGVLIWLTLRPAGPSAAAAGAALWLWNPLVPLEAGMSGHNDLLLVVLLLSSFVSARSGSAVMTGALWAGAATVKAAAMLLVPILGWMLLQRQALDWRLGRKVGGAAAAVALVLLGLWAVGRSPLEGAGVGALGADTERYTNSLHELALAGVRLALGDDNDDVRTLLSYRARYARLVDPSGLWTNSGEGRRLASVLPADLVVLVIAPAESGWRRIEELSTGREGYVSVEALSFVPAGDGPTSAAELEAKWSDREPLRTANLLIRSIGYVVFGLCLIVIGFAVRRGTAQASAVTALLLSFLLATGTWIWPWYLLWPLAFAALSPSSQAVRLTLVVSVASLLIYPLFGYQGTQWWWLFNLRSVFVWALPVLLFGAWEWIGRTRKRQQQLGTVF
jgi:hypothetical protein